MVAKDTEIERGTTFRAFLEQLLILASSTMQITV